MSVFSGNEIGRSAGLAQRLETAGRWLDRFAKGWRDSSARIRTYHRDVERLEEMPDYLLRDIGVDRGNLERMVYFGDPSRSDRH